MTVRAAWLLFAALLPAVLSAADFRSLRMEKDGNRYTVYAETFLLASPDFVYSVLLDYDQFHRLSEGISESRWLDETHANLPLAYTRIDSCVAFFCRKLEKVEMVTASGASEILTEVLPERSDFRHNRTRWRLAAEDGGTRIAYELEMEPDFWVPPLIGPWAIRRKAESSAMKIARRIEYLARQDIPLDQFDLKRYLATTE